MTLGSQFDLQVGDKKSSQIIAINVDETNDDIIELLACQNGESSSSLSNANRRKRNELTELSALLEPTQYRLAAQRWLVLAAICAFGFFNGLVSSLCMCCLKV